MSEHEPREPEPDERGQDEDREGAEREQPDEGGNPWAKTSSGDKESVTSE